MTDVMKNIASEYRNRLKKSSFPVWVEPMLATLTDNYFSDPEWIYERKLDGKRCPLGAAAVCL